MLTPFFFFGSLFGTSLGLSTCLTEIKHTLIDAIGYIKMSPFLSEMHKYEASISCSAAVMLIKEELFANGPVSSGSLSFPLGPLSGPMLVTGG